MTGQHLDFLREKLNLEKNTAALFKDNRLFFTTKQSKQKTLVCLVRMQQASTRNSITTLRIKPMFMGLPREPMLALLVLFQGMDAATPTEQVRFRSKIKNDITHFRTIIKNVVKKRLREIISRENVQILLCPNSMGETAMYAQNSSRLVDSLCGEFFSYPKLLKRSIQFSPHVTISSHGASSEKRRAVQLWLSNTSALMPITFVI